MIWKNEFPNIRWEWRVFHHGIFLMYLEATSEEIGSALGKMAFLPDFERQTIELL